MKLNDASQCETPPLVSLAVFARQIGRTPVTVWRWQKLGWLDASVNIAGKPYLTIKGVNPYNGSFPNVGLSRILI